MFSNFKYENRNVINPQVNSVGYLSLGMFNAWIRLVIWSLQLQRSPYMKFFVRLRSIWVCNGSSYLVQYTKECTRVLQSFVSGHPLGVCDKLVIVGLKGGLPSVIPGQLRLLIRCNDLGTIRACLTFFSVYRILKVPGVLKLNTITDPFKGLCETLPKYEIRLVLRELSISKIWPSPIRLALLNTAGPNNSLSMFGIWKDLHAWKESPLLPSLLQFIELWEEDHIVKFKDLLTSEFENLGPLKDPDTRLFLGRLSLKEEAAGKIRVFAITDAITQTVMAPLHEGIFDLLRTIPMDGTFNQDLPLKRLLERVKLGLLVDPDFYSYDLSAATDRLPITLQTDILSVIMGDTLAQLWRKLLTDRDWVLRRGLRLDSLRYSVGQPMGALSSWGMLALTHHTIVKLAAKRLGIDNFSDYALLGDDIVIANKAVALTYHNIMTAVLGVDINLSKSLISKHSFEFAKRLITLNGEVSPVGAKNLLVAVKSMRGIPSVLLDLNYKGYALSEENLVPLFEKVPTVRKSQFARIKWLVQGPFGFIPTKDGLNARLRVLNSQSLLTIQSLLTSIDHALYYTEKTRWESNFKRLVDIRIYFKLLCEPVGVQMDFKDSPMYHYIDKEFSRALDRMVEHRPIFDRSIGMTNMWAASRGQGSMKLILAKIKATSRANPTILNPFEDSRITLPLSMASKGENFWRRVKDTEEWKKSLLTRSEE